MEDNVTRCVNGDLMTGDMVLSLPGEDYACLVGTVLSIHKAGSPEHDAETGNETDIVHVDFTSFYYSESRVREIEAMLSSLYREPKSFDECLLDDTIMSPDMMIRIDGIRTEDLYAILDSEENASAYCKKVLEGLSLPQSPGHAEPLKVRLFSPMEFFLHDPREEEENGEYGAYDLHDERYKISHGEAWEHMSAIELAVRRERDRMDKTRGLAEYLPDELRGKVRSLFPSIEPIGENLWCVADAVVTEPLTSEEMDALKSWWLSNLSDGWGEGFEQREIQVGREELYAVPWTPDDNFFVDTEQEFQQRLGTEPPAAALEPTSAESPARAALNEPDADDDPATAELRQKLINRLDINLSNYFDDLRDKDVMVSVGMSLELAAWAGAHYYLTVRHNFHTSELNYLLQFKNPLEVVANQFEYEAEIEDHSAVMWDIFDRQDALQGDYELVSEVDGAGLPDVEQKPKESTRRASEPEKTSVLEQIRRGREEAKNRPPAPKEKPAHRRSDPEL